MHQGGGHDFAVALGLLDGDHALGTTAVARVFGDAGTLAVAVFCGREHAGAGFGLVSGGIRVFLLRHQHGDHALVVFDHHAAHTACAATQWAHIVFVKTHGLAAIAEQHHVVLAIRECRANQEVAFVQVDGNDAALARV